jgi:BASS family bile acid:Na+ symporter
MDPIDQAAFAFDPRVGVIVAFMVGFLVFAVALDLTWERLRDVLRQPKAPAIGLVAQFGILPAVAFGAGLYLTDIPSVALGLLLVTCCPGGALSNYLTGVARGDVATSVSMTTISTLCSLALTPLLFGLWASMNPSTRSVLQEIRLDPLRVVVTLLIMLAIPVAAGMLLRARRPDAADRIRTRTRRAAGIVFAIVVAMLIGSNVTSLVVFATAALVPVLITFAIAVVLGWGLARLAGLVAADRRAVAIEVAFQNVALAIGIAVAFFPSLTGVAAVALLWGVVHLVFGSGLALAWNRIEA